jgi:MFS family permease
MAAGSTTRATAEALALLCVAQFVLQPDFAIVNIVLRTIHDQLAFAESSLQWVATGYALTFGSLLLFGGRLGDVLGRRRLRLVAWRCSAWRPSPPPRTAAERGSLVAGYRVAYVVSACLLGALVVLVVRTRMD